MQISSDLNHVSDSDVLSGLNFLHRHEAQTKSAFLVYLNAVAERLLFAKEGCSCLSLFLVERFHYSQSSALKRIQAAEVARDFPVAYALLAEGKLSLSHLQVLSPHLTVENSGKLFSLAQALSVKRLAQALVDGSPLPDVFDLEKPLGGGRYMLRFMVEDGFMENLGRLKLSCVGNTLKLVSLRY